jgi:chitinase
MAVTVDFTTANAWFSSATAGIDYQATSGTLTFLPGETSKTIEVIIYGDTEVEEDEGFLMTLGNAIGADAGMGVSWVAIINDD